ncbi:MAG: aspartate aminotransferase family protein [Acidimicrobiia bacterium]|nr:aspartate aminotransferase family protein [Acidimicrobiia bacterium]
MPKDPTTPHLGVRTYARGMPGAFLHPFAKPTAASFISIVRGEGALVWGADGTEYVDALASLWYCNVGHGRAEIGEAVQQQMGQIAAYHCFERFTNAPADALAERLAALTPMPDARVFFTSSGSEAVESAIKLARLSHHAAGDTERTVVIGRVPSYHGVTTGALSVTGLPLNQAGYGPLLGDVVQVKAHDLDAMAAAMAEHEGRVAAVIAEPVIGAGGLYPPVEGELEGLRRLSDEAGALLIADEVICAFGRLGRWFGSERFGIEPDLATFAKAVTSGYLPLGGVLVGRRVLDVLEADPNLVLRHGHTYSGHPTACAAAMANLDIIEGEGLLERAPKIGARLSAGLRELADEGRIESVRGDGAMWGAELHGENAVAVRDRMLDHGVIARPLGTSAIAFCPPLVVTDDELDRCVEALAAAVSA